MNTMPMDKVFVAVVADVVTEVDATNAGTNFDKLWDAFKQYQTNNEGDMADAKANATVGAGAPAAGSKPYFDALDSLYKNTALSQTATDQKARDDASKAAADARTVMESFFKVGADAKAWLEQWEEVAGQVRKGSLGEKYCGMTNFRLKRVTSSFLTTYSHFRPGDANSRCGLKLGTKDGVDAASGGVVAGEYIIGAWCIGTVLDNSASRSTIGSNVRVASASMAININVNVEWWSGDKLYKNYMDVDGQVLRRDMSVSEEMKNNRRDGTDVSTADLEEAKPWVYYPKP